ncbi:hypothetical protein GCM10027167_55730 [Nocardia heshunensis]
MTEGLILDEGIGPFFVPAAGGSLAFRPMGSGASVAWVGRASERHAKLILKISSKSIPSSSTALYRDERQTISDFRVNATSGRESSPGRASRTRGGSPAYIHRPGCVASRKSLSQLSANAR